MRSGGVCPECGLPGIPYHYGYPSEAGLEIAGAGRAVLGGCEVWPEKPDFVCPRGHEWPDNPTPPKKPRGARKKSRPQPTFASEEEATASTAFASGRYDDAESAYRHLLDTATRRHGEQHPETLALRRALVLVLGAAGRTEDADAVFAPIRRRRDEERHGST
jgi:hypothetical protein